MLVAIAGSIWCIGDAFKAGVNVDRTIYGVDYEGNICGKSPGFENQEYAAWPILPLSQTLDANTYFKIKVCVSSCDETNTDSNSFEDLYQSKPLFKYCFPISDDVIDDSSSIVTEAITRFNWMVNDVVKVWPVIVGAAVGSVLLSLIVIFLMRCKCFRGCLVWISILGLIAGGVAGGILLILYAKEQESSNSVGYENRILAAKIVGWILIGLAAIFFLIVLFLRKRIAIALQIMGASSQALTQMCSLFIYPIVPTIFSLVVAAYWVFGTLILFSVKTEGQMAIPTAYNSIPRFAAVSEVVIYNWVEKYQYLFIYFVFFLFWAIQFVVYSSTMTMAGAVGDWYYSEPIDRSGKKKRGSGDYQLSYFPVLASAWRVIRYHLGTVAFASFILAIILMIRAVVMYIQRRTRKQQNACTRCLFCVVNCCLKCCHSCLDFISRNALIWCAIRGESFCESAFNSFGVLAKDLRLTIAYNAVGAFIIFVLKLLVSLATTAAAGYAIWGIYDVDELSSNVLPLVVIFVITYFIATFFLDIYDSVTDTVFICYLADEEKKFATDKLQSSMNKLQSHEHGGNDNQYGSNNQENYRTNDNHSSYNNNNNYGSSNNSARGGKSSSAVSYV